MLFVDYSSAFSTIIPDILVGKLAALDFPPATRAWIKNFLTNRPHSGKIDVQSSPTLMLSTGSPQGCVLGPLLYAVYSRLYSHPPHQRNNKICRCYHLGGAHYWRIWIGWMNESDEVLRLTEGCARNNLTLNTKKTREVIMDFRRHKANPTPLHINGDCVERVSVFKFLGTHISEDVSWSAKQHMWQRRPSSASTSGGTNWRRGCWWPFLAPQWRVGWYMPSLCYAGCTAADKKRLQRVIRSAEKTIACPLPSLDEIASSLCLSRAKRMISDRFHPDHHLFTCCPLGGGSRVLKAEHTD